MRSSDVVAAVLWAAVAAAVRLSASAPTTATFVGLFAVLVLTAYR